MNNILQNHGAEIKLKNYSFLEEMQVIARILNNYADNIIRSLRKDDEHRGKYSGIPLRIRDHQRVTRIWSYSYMEGCNLRSMLLFSLCGSRGQCKIRAHSTKNILNAGSKGLVVLKEYI